MNSLRRIVAVAQKEVRQLRRDRLTIGMIVGIPTIQLALFGYAINQDVRHLRAGVVDHAQSHHSRELIARVGASQVLDFVEQHTEVEALVEALRRGRLKVGMVVPRDLERRLLRGDRAAVQVLVDGSDPLTLQAARALTALPARQRAAAGPRLAPLFELRPYWNPERRTEVNVVPGLIGVILTMTMVLFTAIALVRERERGNLELLITTPVQTPELMAGKLLPYVAIGLVQATIVLGLGSAFFRVPARGSLLDFYACALVYIVAALCLGLLLSTAAQTQFQAVQLAFFTFLPQILMSGFMFPFDAMPRVARAIGEVLPLTHFVRLVRGVLLRGATFVELWPDVWPLLLFGALALAAALARFRKRLD